MNHRQLGLPDRIWMRVASLALGLSLAFSSSLPAATFTVINTNDSGAGSLRQAMLDANTNAGADVITFNITSGGLTISPTNALPAIVEPVTIDGGTQPGFVGSPIVELNGASAGAAVDGIKIITSNSIIRALVINRFLGDGIEITNGANNKVEGCYLGLDLAGLTDQGNALNGILLTNSPNNTIGGLAATNRNYIAGNGQSGIHLAGALSTNNVLLGNYIGLNVTNGPVANSADGVRVNAPLNVIGGSATGSRNVISGNTGQGIEITALGTGTIVRGNYIGTDDSGTVDRGNSTDGILVSAGGVIIGGANTGEGNLISGNNGDGIEFNGVSATNNFVLGNTIGATSGGAVGLANGANGVLITTSSRSNIIGGVFAGQANLIAFNGGNGISVAAATANTNNTFRGNSIFSNADLGIDLGAVGVTANDAGDTDTGANQLQNFPVLSAVTNTPAGTIIVGEISSRASTTYAIDFYSSPTPDPLGNGEGQTYLGSTNVTTDGSGLNNFTILLPALVGRYVSATATDPFGNTSEFATNVFAVSTVPGQTFTVVNTNDSGAGSLRQAIIDANAAITAGDTIQFAITNLGTTISPASALPSIIDPVTIDGYTQPGAAVNTSADAFNGVLPVRLIGNSAGAGANGLLITVGNCIVRGLRITGFGDHGIYLFGSGNNVIEGCVIGLDAAGVDAGNSLDGVGINASSNNIVGGVALAARNVLSGNNANGVEIFSAPSRNNQVINNLIGTDPTGTVGRGNRNNGIVVSSAGGNIIGGTIAGSGNLVSGNGDHGIVLSGAPTTDSFVFGNRIGMSVTGISGVGNLNNGVLITSSSHNNIVGGVLAGQANVIAFNTDAGIAVSGTASINNTFRGNSIFLNGNLGIDLGSNSATANDANDVDVGANQLQNFPVLSLATNSPTQTTLVGSLASVASTSYVLDFYANTNLDLTGHGEGQVYLGSTNVTTDGSGQSNFVVPFTPARPGQYLSATATDQFGNTSEFSRWAVSITPSTNIITGQAADFVFIIDATSSMAGEIAAVKNGLGSFVTSLNRNNINARFAVVLFGGPAEIIQDFTTEQAIAEAAFDVISVSGAVPGVHNNHNLNPEAGLEAIRIVLNAATNNTIQRNNVGGSGPLAFRPDARKNLILVTDENSDLPFYVENREAGQTGTEPPTPLTAPWQAEVNTTAQAVIANGAFINLLVSGSGVVRNQYGDPTKSVSDANFLNYNREATLTNLIAAGFGNSLEAQVLAAGLLGRAFSIGSVNTPNFIANFFAAKVEEITGVPIPNIVCPANMIAEATSANGAVVTYSVSATASDTPNPIITSTPPSGSGFPIGTTLVTSTAYNAAGGTNSCSFTVTVRDTTPPIITCPANISVQAISAAGTPVSFNVTATDAADTSVSLVTTPPSGSVFPPGTTTVTSIATDDAGNTNHCSFTVTVALQPTIFAIRGRVAEITGAGLAAVNVRLSGGSVNTSALTDGNGDYSFNAVSPGSYTLIPSKAGFTFSPTNAPVTVVNADVTRNFTAAIALIAVRGRVTNCVTGSGIPNVKVYATGVAQPALTDAGGFYVLSNVPAIASLSIVPQYVSGTNVTFSPPPAVFNAPTNDVVANFCGRFSLAITGSVRDGKGLAVGGTTVRLSGSVSNTATTDARGAYAFRDLPGGNFTVTPTNGSWVFAPASRPFTNLTTNQVADFAGTFPRPPATNPTLLNLPGRIAVNSLPGTNVPSTMVINDDGSGYRADIGPKLVYQGNAMTGLYHDRRHAWTRDGTRLALTGYFRGGDFFQLFVMNADGSDVRQLTSNARPHALYPAWSPDGSKIAYVRGDSPSYELVVADEDGRNPRVVARGAPILFSPTWSPDGSMIAFSDISSNRNRVLRVNLDGTNLKEIANLGDFQPFSLAWSPDGARLAYDGTRYIASGAGSGGGLVANMVSIISTNGGALLLTITNVFGVAWSPDGSRIAYYRRNAGIFSAKRDGSDQRLILRDIPIPVPEVYKDSQYGRGYGVLNVAPHSWGPQAKVTTSTGVNRTAQSGATSVSFSNVTTPGETAVIPLSTTIPPMPKGYFSLGSYGAYDIVTSAGFSGPITITFKVPSVTDATTFSRLRVLHGEGGVLVDRTIRAPDSPAPNFAARTISARVSSLSPFLVAEEIDDALPQITGLVVDEQGNPLADLSVSLSGVGETTTDINGQFLFANLTTNAAYTVAVDDSRYVFNPPAMYLPELTSNAEILFVATIAPPPPLTIPPLSITFDARFDNQPTLTWPGVPFDFILESTDSLTNPNWLPAAEPPLPVEEGVAVPLAPEDATRFYRLRQP